MRYKLYPYYKGNRDKHYEDYGKDETLSDYMKEYNARLASMTRYLKKKAYERDVAAGKELTQEEIDDANFKRERQRLFLYLNELYIRWIMDSNGTEADDLIAYYVKNRKPEERIVIVSSDMDLSQLLCDDVYIYNPHLHKNITHKNFKREFGYDYRNVVTKKILCGDDSDNISNIAGLSEKKLFETVPEMLERAVTVDEVIERAKKLIEERIAAKKKPLKVHENIVNGISNKDYNGDFYEINRKIIDLSEPLLTPEAKEEIDSMTYAVQDPSGRSFNHLYGLVLEDKIIDLMDESHFSSFFSSFNPFISREMRRYEEFLKENK